MQCWGLRGNYDRLSRLWKGKLEKLLSNNDVKNTRALADQRKTFSISLSSKNFLLDILMLQSLLEAFVVQTFIIFKSMWANFFFSSFFFLPRLNLLSHKKEEEEEKDGKNSVAKLFFYVFQFSQLLTYFLVTYLQLVRLAREMFSHCAKICID